MTAELGLSPAQQVRHRGWANIRQHKWANIHCHSQANPARFKNFRKLGLVDVIQSAGRLLLD
jgi:hypothetical protein